MTGRPSVCVVGSGGREHALATVLGRTASVIVTPGNAGIAGSTPAPPEEIDADLFVIGPEAPLVDGLADRLRADGKRVFGPGADGARLEGSKAWMKQLFERAGVPTARHRTFVAGQEDEAVAYLATMGAPWVVKTDGLAAGKGVLVADDLTEAQDGVRAYLSGDAFGDAGRTVVVEEGLVGPELSVFAACDGTRAVLFGAAQDHKRIGDGDTGPNTGGMGAYSPVPGAPQALLEEVLDTCIHPTLAALVAEGIDYRGFLFCGLMLTEAGPKVLEYNVRFGDPEAQVVLPRLDGDLTELLIEAASGSLRTEPAFSSRAAVCVVAAAEGYPGPLRSGDVIEGLDAAGQLDDVEVFCAGVGADAEGRLVTAGGRVLGVVGFGDGVGVARERAYAGIGEIRWSGMQYRTDIAAAALSGGA